MMNERIRMNKFLNHLDDSVVLTGTEVVYIREVVQLLATISSHPDTITEVSIIVDAISYYLQDGELVKEEIQSLHLTLATSEVIKVTEQNMTVLLLDSCVLAREVARDIFKAS